jgi:OOP family OmpA-OmpF porin
MDSDGDGVYDGIDKCPDTPKELAVDEFGCPIKVSETETKFLDTGVISTTAINFKFNKAEVTTESYPALDEIGEILVKWPELKVEIGGHTDSKGSESYNMKLSGERADAVKAYLVKKFPSLNTGNLTTKGYGEGSPVATNDTEEGRASNRRVEFKALNPEELKRETETQHYKKR